mmetsp:Transcript_1062/g.2005  ORF Transcript_1062/g.2005 Transcript_1062/m.2005 type:complete len:386 (-) Transcript_1062:1605-2762(-)
MKWGKYLNAVVNETPEWAQFYVNYKRLKGCIKSIQLKVKERRLNGIPDHSVDQKLALLDMKGVAYSPESEWRRELVSNMTVESIEFFELVNEELIKINTFFDSQKLALIKFFEYQAKRGAVLEQTSQKVSIILQQFQNFSTVNYTAIIKALKKHDKNLEAKTQHIYTEKVLNLQQFHTQIGNVIASMRFRLSRVNSVPMELVAGIDDDDDEDEYDDMVSGLGHIAISPAVSSSILSTHEGFKVRQTRDLNNDVVRASNAKKEALCVPTRGAGSKLEVLAVLSADYGSIPRLMKSPLESGETTADAAVRVLLEAAGVESRVVRKIGEFASTSRKNTVYDAYLMEVVRELDEWKEGSSVERRWFQIDDALAEIEDNSSLRVLRRIET